MRDVIMILFPRPRGRFRRSCRGQLQREDAAPARLAVYADLASVGRHDALHQGEPEAAAPDLAARGFGAAPKRLEQVLLLRGGDPEAMVLHLEPYPRRPSALAGAGAHGHP